MNDSSPSLLKSSLIRNGEVHDGLGGPARRVDVRLVDGMITQIGPNLAVQGAEVIDATGLIVAPGLVDLHVHVFSGIGIWSIDPSDAGLRTGVTTMLDTGTAGALTYANMARFVLPSAQEDIYALLNISMLGALQGHPDYPPRMGELNDSRHADAKAAVDCVNRHPERLIGMKVRLTSALANFEEKNEWIGFDGVFDAAEQTRRPLMVHHAASKIPTERLLKALRPGDMYTHMYHPRDDHGYDKHGAPLEAMLDARDRGVIFDVGHGVGSFTWSVAEPACRQFGFWPDTISTDLHRLNLHGPVVDLPTTMTKFLHLGMPVERIVRAATSAPARAMGLQEKLGTLQVGLQADVVLLRLEHGAFVLVDSEGQTRTASQRITPVRVSKKGVWTTCSPGRDLR